MAKAAGLQSQDVNDRHRLRRVAEPSSSHSAEVKVLFDYHEFWTTIVTLGQTICFEMPLN